MKIALPKNEPELVLFDMDGILFDSMPIHTWSWKKTCDEYGILAAQNEFYLFEGMKGFDTITHLYKRTYKSPPNKELVTEIYNRKTQIFKTVDISKIDIIPGVLSFIKFLKYKRLKKIGIVTGSTKNNALERIEYFYGNLFNKKHIVTADDVTIGKPNAEPYLMGMTLFSKQSKDTLIVENAPLGIQAGSASKAFTVGITTGPIPSNILRNSGANLVFPDIQSLHAWWKINFHI